LYLLFITDNSYAQPLVKTNWQAQWIAADTAAAPNTFYKYRYHFSCTKKPAIAIAHIAADSKYWLYINGKLVVFEGQLKRGPTPNDTYFDEVNVQPFLQAGINTIAILVWYWGKQGFCHNSSGKAGLLFQMQLPNQLIISNSKWKIATHKSYGNTGKPLPNFRLPEHNIHYNANMDNEDWIQPNYNTSFWNNATTYGVGGAAPWNALWKRPVPLWYNSGLVSYKNATIIKDTANIFNSNNYYTVKMQLPKNLTVTPYFKIDATNQTPALIDIRTDNYLGGSEPNIRTEYITKKGIQSFETPAYMNGHTVMYTLPKTVKIIELKYRETKYNTSYIGSFTSNDTFINILWQKSANTMNVNMRDAIQDPDRERAQWWGDVVIILEEIFYSCDSRGVDAIKKSISNLLEWQRGDSVLFSPIPAGNWNKELPAQMLASIGKYGIGKYIEYTNDTAMIRYAYPVIKKYMGLWKLQSDGLVQHRSGGWDWHDWGEKIDVPILDNAWYYMALETCFKMATYLQLQQDAVNYKNQMETVATAFQKHFWKGNRFASNEYAFYADDRANGLAICAGLATPQQWQQLLPVLDTIFNAGPYLEKYVLESYYIMNDAEKGLQRMKKRYSAMVNHPTISTLWEGWEIGSSTYGGGTYNHGWSGGPLSLMSKYIAGIMPTSNGYATYTIQPQLGNLKNVKAVVPTNKGLIKVAVQHTANSMKMQVNTIDAQAVIALPKTNKPYKKVVVNGMAKHAHFKQTTSDSNYLFFSCNQKGNYSIVATY
jgi:alpha-L-rhamnosidase